MTKIKYITILSFIAILSFPSQVFSQRGKGFERAKLKKEQEDNFEFYQLVIDSEDPDFESTEVPSEWSDESAVILCQKLHIAFIGNSKQATSNIRGALRKTVKILSQEVIDDFSEFYFQPSEFTKIDLIKSNGDVESIDFSEAVSVTTDVPRSQRNKFDSENYSKIAIPNIEVGDVIDYHKVFIQEMGRHFEFLNTLNNYYPTVEQEIIFDVDKFRTFYFSCFNTDAKITEYPEGGIDTMGHINSSVKRYSLKSSMLKATSDERWIFPYNLEPIIKVMVSNYGDQYYKKKVPYLQTIDTKNILLEHVNIIGSSRNVLAILKNQEKFMTNDESKAEIIYRAVGLDAKTSIIYYGKIFNNTSKISSKYFISQFSKHLRNYEIDHNIVMISPKYLGAIDQVVASSEFQYGLYIPSTGKYYWTYSNSTLAGENNKDVFGAKGYLRTRADDEYKITEITVPESKASDIILINESHLQVNDDLTMTGTENLIASSVFKDEYFFLNSYSDTPTQRNKKYL